MSKKSKLVKKNKTKTEKSQKAPISQSSSFLSKAKDFLINKYDYFLIFIFVTVSSSAIIFHEPWRDEAQAWLIARDSTSITNFLNQMRYEGTPPLWHLLLVILNQFNFPYVSMAILNLIIISFAGFILIKYSKFTKFQKTLILFGYFFIYEYNFIARNYSLSVLILFAIASLYQFRFDRKYLYLFLIGLLATTNSQSFILSTVLIGFYGVEVIKNSKFKIKNHTNKDSSANFSIHNSSFIIYNLLPLLIPIFFIILSLYLTRSPFDLMDFYSRWNFNIFKISNFTRIIIALTESFVPISQIRIDFWNSSLFEGTGILKVIISFCVFFSTLYIFRKDRKIQLMSFFMVSGLLLFFILKTPLSIRHIGFIFLSFIFCLWIYPYSQEIISTKRFEKIFIYSILFFQVFAGIIALNFDYKNQFSAANEAKDFLIKNNIPSQNTLVASYPSYVSESLLPYLPKNTQFYYLEYEKFHSYMIWNKKYSDNINLTDDQVFDRTEKISSNYSKTYIILNHRSTNPKILEKYELAFEGTWDIITDEERYFVYKSKEINQSYYASRIMNYNL